MRGVVVELPEGARKRLAELELQKMAADDAMRGCAQRINSLPRDGAEQLRERLGAERDRHAERHRQLSILVSRVNQWTVELRLPPGTTLEPTQTVNVELKPGETVSTVLAAVRAEIAAVQRELAQVRSAPLRKSSQQEAVGAYLVRLVQRVRPKIGFDVRGNARVMWAEDMVAGKDDVLGLLAFALGPQQLLAAFTRELELEPERADALTPTERENRLSELSASLLSLERREAALLDGVDNILPRPDMDPRAFLGVAVAQAQAQVA